MSLLIFISNNKDQYIFNEYAISIYWIDDFLSLHPVLKFYSIDIPWLVHAKLWSCHNFDILVEKINMFCYSWNTFYAHNHFPQKLIFHPKIIYIGDIVSYRYILDLFIASIMDSNFWNKSDRCINISFFCITLYLKY